MIASNDVVETPIYTIAKCLNEIIVSDDLDNALHKIVEWLSESLEIDCCYILENGKSVGNGSVFAANNLHAGEDITLNTSLFPEVHKILSENRCYKVSINNRVSEELYQWMNQLNLKSLLLIPVFKQNKFWGSIGFGDAKNNRTWYNSEIQLQSLAVAIGSAREARNIKDEIEKSNAVFNATLSALNEIVWEVDLISKTTKVAGSPDFIKSLKRLASNDNIIDWITAFLHDDDRERVQLKYHKFLQDKTSYADEDMYRVYNQKNGLYFWMHSRYKVRRNAFGEPVTITGTSVDISDTKEVGFELSKQREQYEFLVQSLGQVVFTLDKDANCLSLSAAWDQLLGYHPAQSIDIPFIKYISDEHVHLFWQELHSLLAGQKNSFDLELQLMHASGKKVWVRMMTKATFDFKNQIDGFFGTLENIHNKHKANALLQESNERIKTILNNSKEIILTVNLEENTIDHVNEAVSILGYTPEEWIGVSYKTWSDGLRRKFHEFMKLAIRSELQVQNQQINFLNKTNTESIPFEFSTSIFHFKNTKYLLCVLRDVRERLKYEERISRISTQLTHLINNIDDVYAIYDIGTNRYDFVSDNIEALYGCDKKSYCDNTALWKKFVYKDDIAAVEREVRHIELNTLRGEIFYRIITASGERKMLLEKLVVGKDSNGKANKLYIVKKDCTNIENAEQSLMETERKFRFISENLSDFISIHDTDWNFTYASPSIKNILGYEPAEVLGLGGFDLVHPEDVLGTIDNCVQPIVLEKKETQFRYRMYSKAGSYKWVETYSKPVIDSEGEISSIICSTRDVTDQVNAENKLKESEEQYRLLSENSNDIICIHNLKKQFVYISPSCRQVLGYQPSDIIGRSLDEVFIPFEEHSALPDKKIDEVFSGTLDAKFIRKIITKSGDERLLEIWLKPVIKNQQLIAFQSASRDVTEREKLLGELEQSLAKERELNELRAKFVSTASHQFRTPLTVIQSGVELMDMYVDGLPGDTQKRFRNQFQKIQEEVGRLEHLMNDVLLLGRANAARTPFNPVTQSLVSFCNELIDNKYNSRYPAARQIISRVKGSEVPVSFDPKLLSHAIENILSNSYKYSHEGNLFLDLVFEKNQASIHITDQGIGIPEEDVKNLFQPFYRATNTHEIEGTGLGLSIVKEFIEKHNGKIFLDSKLNKGTTVSVILPIE